MRVKTHVGKSPIHGLGIFASEAIKKGTRVWSYSRGRDVSLRANDLKRLPAALRRYLDRYIYRIKGTSEFVLCCDNARFFNHSKKPNCISTTGDTIAIRNIKAGEELTDDYDSFADHHFSSR